MGSKFTVGDKVKVVNYGVGLGKVVEGRILTVKDCKYNGYDYREGWAYQLEEGKSLGVNITASGWVHEGSFELFESVEASGNENKILTLKYSGVGIDLDPSVPFSRKFAEVFLDMVYGQSNS